MALCPTNGEALLDAARELVPAIVGARDDIERERNLLPRSPMRCATLKCSNFGCPRPSAARSFTPSTSSASWRKCPEPTARPDGVRGIVTLARDEHERTIRGTDFQAAATTSRHVVIAAARSTRCD